MTTAAQPKPLKGEPMIVHMGPQHPSTHGVLRVELHTDGEVVERAIPHIGYLHRCKEKIGESVPYDAYSPIPTGWITWRQ